MLKLVDGSPRAHILPAQFPSLRIDLKMSREGLWQSKLGSRTLSYELSCLSSSSYNRILCTGWLKQRLFLTVLKAGRSEIGVPSWSGSGESLLSALQMATFLLCPYVVQSRERRQALSSIMRALIPFMRAPPHGLITSESPCLLMPSQWGLVFQHLNFGQTQTFNSVHNMG